LQVFLYWIYKICNNRFKEVVRVLQEVAKMQIKIFQFKQKKKKCRKKS
jgi:hypothetical protein